LPKLVSCQPSFSLLPSPFSPSAAEPYLPLLMQLKQGPFMPSILRFHISFPSQFPAYPPLITFSSDIFHPLLTPLTTYTYTTSATDTETVSASDQERLPPGGFSLRHGFPHWFKSRPGSTTPSAAATSPPPIVTVYDILDYLRRAFNHETFLDSIPLEAAANPGAYHAWNAHSARKLQASRAASPQIPPIVVSSSSMRPSRLDSLSPPPPTLGAHGDGTLASRGRRPGQWNWEGVWEDRVKRGIQSTVTEQALFGSAAAADEMIRFSNLDPEAVEILMTEIKKREVIPP
jgi:hypothetical protein